MIFSTQSVPVYGIQSGEGTGSKDFRIYQYDGIPPDRSELLVPHRKGHYLIVLIRKAGNTRQWLDTVPVELKDQTIYFTGPDNLIVKEDMKALWSTGVAFTPAFLARQDHGSLNDLPVIRNPHHAHELSLTKGDLVFIEDILEKMKKEQAEPNEWQERMIGAHLAVFLTYLSRLYTQQIKAEEGTENKQLLKQFQAKVNERYREAHEVNDYAEQLHISAGHLSEVIKMQSGKPAIKHIHDRLVMEARRLLFHTDSPLKELAFELGFNDASYFSRFFKRETGQTPAEYRAGIRKMYQ